MRTRAVFALLLVCSVATAAQDSSVFRSNTNLVVVPVTVTDRSGRFVRDLSADQFEISEDGAPRRPTQFSAECVPVSLGILLDISGSMAQDPKARAADDARWADTQRALELLVTRLGTGDEAFFVVFNDKVSLAEPWTQDHAGILRAFDLLQPGGGTALVDAVKLIAPAFRLAQHQRKVLLLITDGNDTHLPSSVDIPTYANTPEQQRRATIGERQRVLRELTIEGTKTAVRRSDAMLYAVGIGTGKGAPVDVAMLESLTLESGSSVEPLRDPSEIFAAVARICDDLQSQYVLAFEPQHADGKYHAITVKTKRNGLRVRARSGYVATGNPNP